MRRHAALGWLGLVGLVVACGGRDGSLGSGSDSGSHADADASVNDAGGTVGPDAATPDGATDGDATLVDAAADVRAGVEAGLDARGACDADGVGTCSILPGGDGGADAPAQNERGMDASLADVSRGPEAGADAFGDATEAQETGPEAGNDSTAGCSSGYSLCGSTCVDTSTDPNNCGACGQVCTGSCLADVCSLNATAIAVGDIDGQAGAQDAGEYVCAVVSGGAVMCWGLNAYGQLGIGKVTAFSSTPVPVSGITGATAVAAGAGHACAIVSGGAVMCWGDDSVGQLGNGAATIVPVTIPVAVSGLTGATAITAGAYHTCAIVSGGAVVCWGSNDVGQLGDGTITNPDGTTANALTPVAVSGITGATAIMAGGDHTCAIVAGGAVMCWGDPNSGNGPTQPPLTPIAVPGLSGVTAIAAGAAHTCALVAGGAVMCWGNNGAGQLGNGTATNASTPVAVSGLSGATAVAAGAGQTCAIVTGGAIMCWGSNVFGQLGDGTTANESLAVPVSRLTGATALAAGQANSCAIVVGGAIECWGGNGDGQLGIGTRTDSSVPVVVVQ